MLLRNALLALAFPLVAAACGGGATPSPQTPEKEAAEQEKAPAAAQKSLADNRRDFMAQCSGKVPGAPDYCECSWEQMTKTFSLEEMNAPEAEKGKIAQLKDRIEGVCKSKLPEGHIKQSFVSSCAGDAPKLAPYCECNWDALRKRFSAAELADEATAKAERFITATHEVAKTCAPKLPEDVARDGFVRGCAKDEALKPFCGCAWKTLRGAASAADIMGGVVNIDAQRPKLEKACGKLRPAQ